MPYAPGESGNPAGRPRGARGRAAVLRESIDAAIPQVIETLVRQAVEGDVSASRLLIERVLPPIRATGPSVEVEIAGYATGDLASRAEAVVSALGKGQISVDLAGSLMSALSAQAGITETSDLIQRITRLEEALRVNVGA